jgi:hypothetical protein
MPPAIGLLAAAGSVSAGMAAVGGTMAGFLGAGLGTQLIAGAMIAGGVMTGLGAVTGNKKLQKWGGVLSLAGGVAGLATGAWASTASSVAEGAARESFRASELAAAAGGAGDAAGGMLQAGLGTTDLGIGQATGIGSAPMTPAVTPTAPATVNIVNGGGTQATAGGLRGTMDVAAQRLSDVGTAGKGMLSDSMAWMEKNPRITQAGAGLLQAGLGAYGQQDLLKEQMKMQDEQQARARKRLSDSVAAVDVPVYQRKGP